MGAAEARRHWWKRAELTHECAQTIHGILMLYCEVCGTNNLYRLKFRSLYFTAHHSWLINLLVRGLGSWLIGVRLVHSWASSWAIASRGSLACRRECEIDEHG